MPTESCKLRKAAFINPLAVPNFPVTLIYPEETTIMLKQSLLAITFFTVPLMANADVGAVKGNCGPNQVANNKYLERVIENLESRVNAGVKDGSLVPEESSKLSSRIMEARTKFGHMNKNGVWAVAEGSCDKMEGRLQSLSDGIAKQRHDKDGNIAGSSKAKAQAAGSKK